MSNSGTPRPQYPDQWGGEICLSSSNNVACSDSMTSLLEVVSQRFRAWRSAAKRLLWNWLKKKFRIRSWESLVGKHKRNLDRIRYRRRYTTEVLVNILKGMGLRDGCTVLIHSSWDEFYNYEGTVNSFIDAILGVIGVSGTLVMPAYPLLRKSDSIFDITRTPTSAGLIAETFRKYPGVKRSVNRHSVCALGPMSEYLLSDHQDSITSWDEKSPYYRLAKVNALVLTLGLGRYFVGTIMHCADSILREEIPYFSQFFQKEAVFRYRLEGGRIYEQQCLTASDDFEYRFTNRSHNSVVQRYFEKTKYARLMLSNLTVNSYDAAYFINRVIEIGRQGVTVYTKPPWPDVERP